MNRSKILRILRALGIVAVLALAGVGLEHTVVVLSQAGGSAASVTAQPTATATVAPPPPAQVQVAAQPTATATIAPPPPAQVQVAAQPTATASVVPLPPMQVQVEGFVIAVNTPARTITVQDDDGGPATVVALGTAGGTYAVGQKVKVYGLLTSAGSNGATVQAQFIRVDSPDGDNDGGDGGDHDGD